MDDFVHIDPMGHAGCEAAARRSYNGDPHMQQVAYDADEVVMTYGAHEAVAVAAVAYLDPPNNQSRNARHQNLV